MITGHTDIAIFPREMAQSKSHIGISPSGPKIGLWDQSQCSVQSIIGIDPNVMKKRVWELSQCHVQTVIGIDPNVMKNKTLGQIPVIYILGLWDKSQNY